MAGRRAVAVVLKAGDDHLVTIARDEVYSAKVGLGERGPVW